MAETFLFDVAVKVLGKLSSLVIQQFSLARGVYSELQELENTISAIRSVLLDAEEKQANNHQLTDWLGKIKDALYDADDVLDEFQYEALRSQVIMNHGGISNKVRSFVSCSNSLGFRLKMGHKIKEIRKKLDGIAAEKAKFHLAERSVDMRVVHQGRETHSFVRSSDVIGRDDDKEKVVQFLMHPRDEENVSIIPIVGIGGLGKTTLAKLVYNDERVSRHFDLKMWVCVSDDFDLKKLTKDICKSANGRTLDNKKFNDDPTIDELQTETRSTLDNQKFLLILDDVWNDDRGKWMELRDLLLGGANGSRIIVTTRSQLVASIMGTIPVYNLEGLPHMDCFSLFVKWAFQEGEEKQYPKLLSIGDEIVKKCKGVPLAVRTLGSLLYLKTNENDWLHIRDNEIWKLEQKENDILPALRLSYNQMPSYLRQCFSLCSIFPKDLEFTKFDLINLWTAQGLLQSSQENEELEDIGERYVKELKWQSFLQDSNSLYAYPRMTMHDLVHDLALLVAQTECHTINYNTHDNISKGEIFFKTVRHVSFPKNGRCLDEVPRVLLHQDNLRTIFFPTWSEEYTTESFVRSCISRFKCLRVLDIRGSVMKVLPSSISKLKHLRLLNLSGCHTLEKLPNSICKLYNLHTLRVEGCPELKELPRDIGKLSNLRNLSISTKHAFLSQTRIGCVVSLRCLMVAFSDSIESLGEEMQSLTNLRILTIWNCYSMEFLTHNMRYLTALTNLTIEVCEMLNLESEEDLHGLKLNLQYLWLEHLPRLEALPQWLQGASDTMQFICICNCRNLQALPEWLQNFTSLQRLVIINCPQLSALPEEMHCLTTLKELTIQGCPQLRSRCKPETGEDWHKIAHVPEMRIDHYESDGDEGCSRPDDTLIPLADYEGLQQEIALLKEENRVLRDMVSGRSNRDEAGPSTTAGIPPCNEPLAAAAHPSPSTTASN